MILHVVMVYTSGSFWHTGTKMLRLGILMIQGRDHGKNVDFGSEFLIGMKTDRALKAFVYFYDWTKLN